MLRTPAPLIGELGIKVQRGWDMSDASQLQMLLTDPERWNAWRWANPLVRPDLTKCNLSNQRFPSEMNFREVDLSRSNLSNAFLARADFYKADLSYANLTKVDAVGADFHNCTATEAKFDGAWLLAAQFLSAKLERASFCASRMTEADLSGANLRGADLSNASMQSATLMDANLSSAKLIRTNLNLATMLRADLRGATLSECQVHGVSTWRVQIDGSTVQSDLSINDPADPLLTVDDLEIAQFIYLLLNHEKLRNSIQAVTEKGVLILGRFADGGLDTLHVVREELRRMGYLPFIFDFDCPTNRNLTETVMVMVGLSRFVIADLSGPSVPHELATIVPHFKVPLVPILQKNRCAYAMARDILQYSWVVKPICRYDTLDKLKVLVATKIVPQAEKKAKALSLLRRTR